MRGTFHGSGRSRILDLSEVKTYDSRERINLASHISVTLNERAELVKLTEAEEGMINGAICRCTAAENKASSVGIGRGRVAKESGLDVALLHCGDDRGKLRRVAGTLRYSARDIARGIISADNRRASAQPELIEHASCVSCV